VAERTALGDHTVAAVHQQLDVSPLGAVAPSGLRLLFRVER
jgi:hypothetical protein